MLTTCVIFLVSILLNKEAILILTYLPQYFPNTIISAYNQYKILEIFYFQFLMLFSRSSVYLILRTCLSSHCSYSKCLKANGAFIGTTFDNVALYSGNNRLMWESFVVWDGTI